MLELRIVSRRLHYSVREDSAGHGGFRDRLDVTRRHRLVAKRDVTLSADKLRALVSLSDLVIKRSTFVDRRRDVATLGAAARFHRNFLRRINRRIERRHLMTLRTFQLEIGVDLVLERSGGNTISRRRQRPPVFHFHLFGIKVCYLFFGRRVFVTRVATGW